MLEEHRSPSPYYTFVFVPLKLDSLFDTEQPNIIVGTLNCTSAVFPCETLECKIPLIFSMSGGVGFSDLILRF